MPAHIVLRKFTGSSWGPPAQISDAGNPGNFDIVQDPNGVLHFAWVDTNGNVEYRYGRDASNSDFTRPQTLLSPSSAGTTTCAARSRRTARLGVKRKPFRLKIGTPPWRHVEGHENPQGQDQDLLTRRRVLCERPHIIFGQVGYADVYNPSGGEVSA